MTPLDMIQLCLHDAGIIGVGQTALAEDTNKAFTRLNMMISQWATQRWLVYALRTLSKVSTGAQSYTIGPGQDYDIAVRPNRLEAAFLRQIIQSSPNQVDYPLQLILAREDYNNIALKQLVSFPTYVFYDSAWPVGNVFAWPIPQPNIYSLHVTVKTVIPRFVTLTETVDLPQEYDEALRTNLTVRLRQAYRLPLDPADVLLAKNALNVIRGSNNQIAELQMPAALSRPTTYDPYSDQLR